MIIYRESKVPVKEAQFKHGTIKDVQVSGTRAKISIEIDLASGINGLGKKFGPVAVSFLATKIAEKFDKQAHAYAVNDDHELEHLLDKTTYVR